MVLQWRPTGTLLVTLDDNFSRDTLEQEQYGYSVWFNSGQPAEHHAEQQQHRDQLRAERTPTDFQGQINASKIRNNITGLNLKWDATERQTFEFDAAYAEAQLNPNGEVSQLDMDVGYGPSGNNTAGTNGTNIGIAGISSNGLQYPTGFGPGNDKSRFINNGIIGSHVLPILSNQNTDIVKQFRVMGTWKEAEGLQINYGLSYVIDNQNLKQFDTFVNNDWQLFAGYGPASGNTGGFALPQELFTRSFSTSGFISGFKNNGNLPPRVLVFDPHAVISYLEQDDGPDSETGVQPQRAGRSRRRRRPRSSTSRPRRRSTRCPCASISACAREKTQVGSLGFGQLPAALTVLPNDKTAFTTTYTSATPTPVSSGSSYQHLLPNLDMVLAVSDEWRVRLDASRTLTRPRAHRPHAGAGRAAEPARRRTHGERRQPEPEALSCPTTSTSGSSGTTRRTPTCRSMAS